MSAPAAWDTAGPGFDDVGFEWRREFCDEDWDPPAHALGLVPARCACKRLIVATVEETLDCPGLWWWTGAAWAHVLGHPS